MAREVIVIKIQMYVWKMATKLGMYLVTQKSIPEPVGRDKTALRTTQIAGFIHMLSEKKINVFHKVTEI